jgi:hypothetical protein
MEIRILFQDLPGTLARPAVHIACRLFEITRGTASTHFLVYPSNDRRRLPTLSLLRFRSNASSCCGSPSFSAMSVALVLALISLVRNSAVSAASSSPEPGNTFVKELWLDPRSRDLALAGGHDAPPEMRLRVQILLTPENSEAFNELLSELSTPGSPKFGHQLQPNELTPFERPESDYEAITSWLSSYGVHIISVDRSAPVRAILADGTAAQFESTFNVRIMQSADVLRFATVDDPQVPEKFKDVIAGITGLDNLAGYGKCCPNSMK